MIPIVVFIFSSLLVYFMYTHTQNYFMYNTLKFSSLPTNKQFYVVKNVIKGCYLLFLVLAGCFTIVPGVIYNVWDNDIIRVFASMYVSNDFIGLYRVSSLPTSTRLHHTASIIFLLVAWSIDFQDSNVGQLLLLYTYFSALSFPVNLYLGLRLCYDNLSWLKTVSKYVYLFSCLMNWYIQITWSVIGPDTLVYMFVMSVIVFDDIILLRWLWT